MTVRVLLADDEELIRTGLRVIIDAEADLEVVGEAGDGVDALEMVRRLKPDVVLMDVRMPTVDGLEATERIVSTVADPPKILVVTTFDNDEYVYQALRAGADGFLLKRARPDRLLEAIRVVVRGDSLLFPAAIRDLATRHRGRPSALRRAGLTEREEQVLRLMATGRTNAEIAAELYVSAETVKTHVGNVLGKLRVRDRTQAVIAAYESGFV
ncbi:response regulator [Phytomonospora endophytica]|uniref:DNA-binding NarL/FixJ family response regulator n=1 Tax=Phytomonospora endophytica TaxID=714109 RepID=A0A841FQP8_9ACTN|nr:response regulator transcription factor [Phytomonospora endophytica]MBB6035882.1 DNA-binding NarL/FixJ family response regulator [Phytomonospora endophytica]